ncbi:MAG: ThiF family adenylyltransferase [Legionella sp.]|uniref:ThiF family adenylyltransferase n=1 Tax=Legionella sp. TaxID=459 RepID=UPI0039E706D7
MMNYIKSPCFEAFTLDGNNVIFTGSRQKIITNQEFFFEVIEIANFCNEPRNSLELNEFMIHNHIKQNSLEYALEHKILINNQIDLSSRYSRNDIYLEYQGIDSKALREKLQEMNFLIAGCGGIGNIMSFTMTSLGAKNLILLDDDVVEISNLNRQFLFTEEDVGQKKVDALERSLKKINSTLNIKKINSNLERLELNNSDVSLIILSADSDNALEMVTRFATSRRIPILSVGYLADISCVGPFYIPRVSSCPLCTNIYTDEHKEIDERLVLVNSNYKAPSAPMNNFLASILAVNDIINFISGNTERIKSLNKRYGMNSFTFEQDYIDCPISGHCRYCSDN